MCFFAAAPVIGPVVGPAFMTATAGGAAWGTAALTGTALSAAQGGAALGFGSFGGALSSAYNFVSSPGFSAFTQVVGFGMDAMGQQAQYDSFAQQVAYREAILQNNRIIADRAIARERLEEETRQRLISEQGKGALGDVDVEAAGRGVLARVGSAQDKRDQLAGDIAYAKANSQRNSELNQYNLEITKTNFRSDAVLLAMQLGQADAAKRMNILSSGVTRVGKATSRFRWDKGGLAFRT